MAAYRLPCGCVDHQHFGVGHTVAFCPEGARLLAAADAAAEAANADESAGLSEAEEDALADAYVVAATALFDHVTGGATS